jgi:predicted nuclease of restriction endonuclease-like (RecB) superfamily
MSEIEIVKSNDYARFFADLKEKVLTSQRQAVVQVNRQLIMLYHHIGTEIIRLQKEKGWGSKVVDQLSRDLKSTFPDMKGFSPRNLKYMRQFAHEYPDIKFVQQVAAQLPWFHLVTILSSEKEPTIRQFYIQKSLECGWSRNILSLQIETKLHEREGSAVTNFTDKLLSPFSDLAEQSLKDPYMFDFLTLHDKAQEREIERALVKNIRKFLLELGGDFAFLGNQYHLLVGKEDFYVDMLFYNIKLRCFVAIELKAGEFKPEYAGKISFYLAAIDDLLRHPTDNPTIGLILCKHKNNVTAEYALKNINAPIGLAEYKLERAIPDDLKTALPSVEEIEAELNRPTKEKRESYPASRLISTETVDKAVRNSGFLMRFECMRTRTFKMSRYCLDIFAR